MLSAYPVEQPGQPGISLLCSHANKFGIVQRDTQMTLTEVVRMLTDIQSLLDVPRRISQQQDAKVHSSIRQKQACQDQCLQVQ